ncbi:MAG: hypothetical protein AAGI53_08280 [Planctomycetota bacterium]
MGDGTRTRTMNRRTLLHLALLTGLCAVAYLPGLTDHGLTNWQEAVRLLAAQEMDARGDWVRPTIHGETYLAKPPLIYWCQMAIATATGRDVGLFDLRLTVALAGWLGVLSTYWCALVLLRSPEAPDAPSPETAEGGSTWASRAAFWSAAMLATGVMTSRAARIGELDVLLVTFTPVVIGASFKATWAQSIVRSLPWVLLASLGFIGLSLSKGPPGMLTGALAVVGGTVINAIHREPDAPPQKRSMVPLAITGAVVGASTTALIKLRSPEGADFVGVGFFAIAAAIFATFAIELVRRPGAMRSMLGANARTAWPIAAAIGFAALYLWSLGIESADTSGVTTNAASEEASDNISLFVLSAPLRALEVFAYGAGLGSIAAIASVIWQLKDRPRLPRGVSWAVAWVFLSMIIFSATTRGTHRYLLPMLPGVALLGGTWLASWLRDVSPKHSPRVIGIGLTLAAFGLGWWYGYGRDDRFAARSPRDFMASVVADPIVDPARVAVLDWWDPGLTIYAGHPVLPYADLETSIDIPNRADPIETLREQLAASGGTITLIFRDAANPEFPDEPPARQRLAALGFEILTEPTEPPAEYLVDRRSVPMTYAVIRSISLEP